MSAARSLGHHEQHIFRQMCCLDCRAPPHKWAMFYQLTWPATSLCAAPFWVRGCWRCRGQACGCASVRGLGERAACSAGDASMLSLPQDPSDGGEGCTSRSAASQPRGSAKSTALSSSAGLSSAALRPLVSSAMPSTLRASPSTDSLLLGVFGDAYGGRPGGVFTCKSCVALARWDSACCAGKRWKVTCQCVRKVSGCMHSCAVASELNEGRCLKRLFYVGACAEEQSMQQTCCGHLGLLAELVKHATDLLCAAAI